MSVLILGYSDKWKSKALIKRALAGKLKPSDPKNVMILNKKDPGIDFIETSIFSGNSGKWCRPEEYRKHTGNNTLTFTNRKRSF